MAVQREVAREARFRYRLKKLYETGFFVKCAASDSFNVRQLSLDVGEGEAEALIQAQEKAALFFIGDDKRAREIGHNLGLRCVGTVRLLARLHLEERAGDVRVLIRKLQHDLQFRVSEDVIEEAVALAPAPI
jgi:predicted nucleic acid-binding protein